MQRSEGKKLHFMPKKIFRLNTFLHSSSSSELTMSAMESSLWNFRAMQNLWCYELPSAIMRNSKLVISYLKCTSLLMLRNGMKITGSFFFFRKTGKLIANFFNLVEFAVLQLSRRNRRASQVAHFSNSLRLIKNFCCWSELFRKREHELMHFNRIAFKDPQSSTVVCIYFPCWRCLLLSSLKLCLIIRQHIWR